MPVITGLLFMAGMRRSRGRGAPMVPTSTTLPTGPAFSSSSAAGRRTRRARRGTYRFVKGAVAGAVRTLRAEASPAPEDRVVPLSPKMVGLRFQAAARAAGVEQVTAHSGRVGLASELTSRGASTTDVMLAGNWKTSRMVAHYSAGATAERGAVARYLPGSRFARTRHELLDRLPRPGSLRYYQPDRWGNDINGWSWHRRAASGC